MEPDRKNLLQHLDDPPATVRGLLAGAVVLFLLLALVTGWDCLAALLAG